MSKKKQTEVIFDSVMAAVARKDVDGLLEFFAEDAAVVDFTDPGVVHRGSQAVGEFARGIFDMFSDLRIEIVDLVADERLLAIELVAYGTPIGQADEKKMHYSGFYAFRDGKIVSEHLYGDAVQWPA